MNRVLKSIALTLGFVCLGAAGEAIAAPAAPAELQCMRLLYGPGYSRPGSVVQTPDPRGIRVNKPSGYQHMITEYVTPWKTATFVLGGTRYFVATGQGHAVEDPGHPSQASHAQAAYISAIWFARKAGHWAMVGKEINLSADGSFGQVVGRAWTAFPSVTALRDTVILVADEGGYMNQGYAVQWFPIYEFTARGLRALGNVPSGADNTGSGMKPLISFKGRVTNIGLDAHARPEISVLFNGRSSVGSRPVALHDTRCAFDYVGNPAGSMGRSFETTGPECAAILSNQ